MAEAAKNLTPEEQEANALEMAKYQKKESGQGTITESPDTAKVADVINLDDRRPERKPFETTRKFAKRLHEWAKRTEKPMWRDPIQKGVDYVVDKIDSIGVFKWARNIDKDEAFRRLPKWLKAPAMIIKGLGLAPRYLARGGGAVAKLGAGIISSPRYIYKGLTTIPGNLADVVWRHPSNESMPIAERWKNMAGSAWKLLHQPISTPAISFKDNQKDNVERLWKSAKGPFITAGRGLRNILWTLQKTEGKEDRSIAKAEKAQAKARAKQLKLKQKMAQTGQQETPFISEDMDNASKEELEQYLAESEQQEQPEQGNVVNLAEERAKRAFGKKRQGGGGQGGGQGRGQGPMSTAV